MSMMMTMMQQQSQLVAHAVGPLTLPPAMAPPGLVQPVGAFPIGFGTGLFQPAQPQTTPQRQRSPTPCQRSPTPQRQRTPPCMRSPTPRRQRQRSRPRLQPRPPDHAPPLAKQAPARRREEPEARRREEPEELIDLEEDGNGILDVGSPNSPSPPADWFSGDHTPGHTKLRIQLFSCGWHTLGCTTKSDFEDMCHQGPNCVHRRLQMVCDLAKRPGIEKFFDSRNFSHGCPKMS